MASLNSEGANKCLIGDTFSGFEPHQSVSQVEMLNRVHRGNSFLGKRRNGLCREHSVGWIYIEPEFCISIRVLALKAAWDRWSKATGRAYEVPRRGGSRRLRGGCSSRRSHPGAPVESSQSFTRAGPRSICAHFEGRRLKTTNHSGRPLCRQVP